VTKLDIAELGEGGLIEAIRAKTRSHGGRYDLGIGDDAARLRPRPGCDWITSTDAMVESVHFRWHTTDPASLGCKALAVNLSDLAAMGAEPRGFLLTWGLPSDAQPERLSGLLSGLLAESRRTKCPLLGGDTVRSSEWWISITVFGEAPRGRALLRSGARAGDRVCVTGSLGGAALGLALLEHADPSLPRARPFVRRQIRPRAQLEAGARLVEAGCGSAAIDLSDGLVRDAGHVARASQQALHFDLDRLPLMRGLRSASAELGLDAEALAIGGGEDYELLFCVTPEAPEAPVLSKRLGCRVTEIGRVCAGDGVHFWRNGVQVAVKATGYEHFKRIRGSSDK